VCRALHTFREQLKLGRQIMRKLLRVVPALALIALAAPASAWAGELEVLTQTEQESALKYGQEDGTVTSLEAMQSSSAVEAAEQISGHKQPAEAQGPTAQAMTSTPVDVVVLHGHFVAWDTPGPKGQPTQEGTVLELVTNRLTGAVVASSLGDTQTVTFGNAVERESVQPSGAQVAHLLQLRADARRSSASRRVHHGQAHHGQAHAATWDSHCKATSNTHCYAVAEWWMPAGSGERIIGSHYLLFMAPGSGATPGGEQFVDDEEWMAPGPDGETQGGWAESGLIKGYGERLFWFYAFKDGKWSLVKYLGPPYTIEEAEGEWDRQGLESRGNGEYCVLIGWEYQDVYWCGAVGFVYSKDVEDGSEMADESAPEIAGGSVSNYEGAGGGFANWNKAEYETEDGAGEHVGLPVCTFHWPGEPAGYLWDGTVCSG
jgi:hypothetical protein